jgi:uncharacterized membrane-anchored protein
LRYKGQARLDKKTKNLVKRLHPGDIAIIDHEDIDRVTAETLVDTRVEVVVNASKSISGRYSNLGPLILTKAGIQLLDDVGKDIFTQVKEEDILTIHNNAVIKEHTVIARGTLLSTADVELLMEQAKTNMGKELEKFAQNTLEFISKEKEFLEGVDVPETRTNLKHRHALIVSRGYDYKEDLRTLRAYIQEFRPVLIGVDGGADALLETGYKPHIIIGDMDSVSEKCLKNGAELIVHAYPDGKAPGLDRLKKSGFDPLVFRSPGTSEDIAMLLAYEKGAELIVAVGSHANMVEFLDKGRKGMASTFLVRLRVGPILVDAKGVNKLYRSTVKPSYFLVILMAALLTLLIMVQVSPMARNILRLLVLKLRLVLKI